MKKIIGILMAVMLMSVICMADTGDMGNIMSVIIAPLSPEFNLDKNEMVKEISVTNNSNINLLCTPEISNDKNFVNNNYSLVSSLYVFPTSAILKPQESANFKLYLYNTAQLQGDGEFDAVLGVNTKSLDEKSGSATIMASEAGVVKAFRGKLIQKISLDGGLLKTNVDLSIADQYSLIHNFGAKKGSTLDIDINNNGNIHSPYTIEISFEDKSGKELDNSELTGSVIRGTSEHLHFATAVTEVTQCVATLFEYDSSNSQQVKVESLVVESSNGGKI